MDTPDQTNAAADTPVTPTDTVSTPAPAMASADPSTPAPVSTDAAPIGSAPGELPNIATTTVDDVTFAKAAAESTDTSAPLVPGTVGPNPDAMTTGELQEAATVASDKADAVVETAPKVLQDAQDAGPIVQTADVAKAAGDMPALVVAPTMADAMQAANEAAVAPDPIVPVTASVIPDIGAALVDTADRQIVVSAPAQPKKTGDGMNAGAVDPTGYVAPVRVSAAGVPATDPTVMAASSGDLSSADATMSRPAGTSDQPDRSLPSLGAASSAEATDARIGGNAQTKIAAGVYTGQTSQATANQSAQVAAQIEARTGAPQPASAGDQTLTNPTPAGDIDAAARVAALSTTDPAPAPDAAPVVPVIGAKADPNAVATAVDAAQSSDKPMADVNDPATARPVDDSPTPAMIEMQGAPLLVDHPVLAEALPGVADLAKPVEADLPSVSLADTDASPLAQESSPIQASPAAVEASGVTVADVHVTAAQDLANAGLIPAPVLVDIKATAIGPTSESDLSEDDGDLFTVTHSVMLETHYVVRAKSADLVEQAIKDGKGVSKKSHHTEDWSVDEE